jgi:hypothetical protein
LTCYLPGIYTDNQGFKVNTGEVAYLMPGAYSFPSGATIRGTLTGGLISNQPGIVISLPESGTVTFGAQNAQNVVLNFGSETCASDTCRAAPAVDAGGTQIKTPQGLTISMEVARDSNCFSGTTPTNAGSCNVNSNRSINLAGSGRLLIGGILYGPSDNMSINGGSAQRGVVGQIISWSVTYTGGSTLDQSYPGSLGNGVLRLETACSGPGTTCVP